MNKILTIALLSSLFVFSSYTKLDVQEYKLDTIVIDAGHGGKDPGCHGDFSKEKNVVLDVARELGRIIRENKPEVKVIFTRDDDKFVPLHKRAEIANKKDADLFISLHANAGPPSARGSETYAMGLHTSEKNLKVAKRENSVILKEDNYKEHYKGYDPNDPSSHILFANYQSAYLENSLNLAQKVQHQFEKRVGRHNRGVKQAGFLVLWQTSMPSVLIELGFLTNDKEEKYLNKDRSHVYLASGIYRAFRNYKKEIESLN